MTFTDTTPPPSSLIRELHPHAYTTIGGAPITVSTIRTLQGMAATVGSIWSAGPLLRTARPIPWPALAATDLIEDDDA